MGAVSDIKKYLKNNVDKKSYFVKWYVDSDKTEESFNNDCKSCAVTFEYAMNNWLLDEDVQDAIRQYLKAQRNIKMMDIYNAMYQKALTKGDTNSAKWCADFFKSDFFEDEQDEVDDYLSGIDIPALKSGGK